MQGTLVMRQEAKVCVCVCYIARICFREGRSESTPGLARTSQPGAPRPPCRPGNAFG